MQFTSVHDINEVVRLEYSFWVNLASGRGDRTADRGGGENWLPGPTTLTILLSLREGNIETCHENASPSQPVRKARTWPSAASESAWNRMSAGSLSTR